MANYRRGNEMLDTRDLMVPYYVRAVSEPMPTMDLKEENSSLTPSDVDLLERVLAGLPILADLSRADLLLHCPGPDAVSAAVIGHAQPRSVSPVYPESLIGHVLALQDDLPVCHALRPDATFALHSDTAMPGKPTIQEVLRIRNSRGVTVAALSIETNVVEHERHCRRSIVFRRALSQLQRMGARGELAGASEMSPFGEHDGIVVVDPSGRIRYVSGVAENLHRKLGYTDKLVKSSIASMHGHQVIFDLALRSRHCVELEAQEGQLTWIRKAIPIWQRRRAGSAAGSAPGLTGVLITIRDATDARHKEQELRIKAAMIQEIHHRVKNNLQTIAALLRIQARRVADPYAQVALQESVSRILSVAVVHEFLSHDETAVINIREVSGRILEQTKQGIVDPTKGINLVLSGSNLTLPAQRATACALVINELVQNAVEHGYSDRRGGTITLNLAEDRSDMVIEVSDDGEGLPAGFDLSQSSSLGLHIVQTLVREDLKGSFQLTNGRGVRAVVRFPRASS
jgi:two-component sensor histidine kinase/PAS domain-containing protein